jgi:hypothetical protein
LITSPFAGVAVRIPELRIFQEGVGFGIASLDASSEEAQALREALYQIRRKQKIVTIEGVEYRLRARIHQLFGEDVFQVTIKKGRKAKP